MLDSPLTASHADRLFAESLDRDLASSQAFVPSYADASSYLPEQLSSLRSARVSPVPVRVRPDESARTFGPWLDREYDMYIVARAGTQILLVSADSGLFSLGATDAAGDIGLVGFASDDALAE